MTIYINPVEMEINILGSGLSGMSCALMLAKQGVKVNVFETAESYGLRFKGDWQGIENWSEKTDALDRLTEYGVKTDFYHHSMETINLKYGDQVHQISDEGAIAYLVLRGYGEKTLDTSLYRQCLKHDVNFNFSHTSNKDIPKWDIIATGPKNPTAYVRGIKFKSKQENKFFFATGNDIAKGFYSYMFILEGEATVASVLKKDCQDKMDNYLDKTIEFFGDHINEKELDSGLRFTGFGEFDNKLPLTSSDGALIIGEAGGLQDMFMGFGMKYAFTSAYLATKSIIENKNYEKLIKTHIKPMMAKSKINRRIYETFGNLSNKIFIKALKSSESPKKTLRKIYTWNPYA